MPQNLVYEIWLSEQSILIRFHCFPSFDVLLNSIQLLTTFAFRIKLFHCIWHVLVLKFCRVWTGPMNGLLLNWAGLAVRLVSTIGVKNATQFYVSFDGWTIFVISYFHGKEYGFKYNNGEKNEFYFFIIFFLFFTIISSLTVLQTIWPCSTYWLITVILLHMNLKQEEM